MENKFEIEKEDTISINDINIPLKIYDDSIIYIKEEIKNFDPRKLEIIIYENTLFEILISKSYDGVNWSELKTQEQLITEFEEMLNNHDDENPSIEQKLNIENMFISIWCRQYKEIDDIKDIPETIYQQKNIDDRIPKLYISGIIYVEHSKDSDELDPEFGIIVNDYDLSINSKDIRIQTLYQLINQFPKWNFYDNQQITIKRWLEQCNSLAESYGHTCIYFKTTPIEVSHTLSVNVVRNVTSIKKLHIMFPNNELPQDRNTFTDWDLAIQDDFICHVIVDKFEQAFGKNTVPEQRDYLYLPIINKIFRVTSMQAKNGFMGKIGWWEVFLAKYEDDECVVIEDDLKKAMGGFPDINDAMDTVEQNYENMKLQNHDELKPLLDEIEIFKTNTILSSESIDQKSIDEKKKATQNFTDKLNDSTTYVSAKETDSIKEFISKRLNIVSVNPDKNIYPVTMYNCTEINKRTVALTYNIFDFIKVNKKSNTVINGFDLNFNYVLFQKFTGEIFDIISNSKNEDGTAIMTVEQNRKKISLILHNYQKTFDLNFVFEDKIFYQVCINFKRNVQPNINQIAVKIFSIIDKQKKLEYQNTYIIEINNNDNIYNIDRIYLYGGQFFTNDIELNIDEKNIIMDNANPIVNMNKFAL